MMSRLLTRREQWVIGFVGTAILVGSGSALWLNRSGVEAQDVPEEGVVPAVTAPETAAVAAPGESESPAEAPDAVAIVPESAAPAEIVVSIRGAVANPGVFTLSSTDRVHHLITSAGGLSEGADITNINLAATLIDGTTLTIPAAPAAESRDGVVVLRRRTAEAVNNPPQYTLSGWGEGGTAAAEADATFEAESAAEVADQGTADDSRIDLNHATSEELQELPGIGPVLAQSIIDFREDQPFESADDLQHVRGIGPKRFEALRDLVTVNR